MAGDAIPDKILLSADRIARRVREIAEQIEQDYAGGALVLVCVLRGSFVFVADLARALRLPVRIEFLAVRSYGDASRSSGEVQIIQDLRSPISGDDVLVVEDIVDTGLTSHYLLQHLEARGAKSVKLCALLHKPSRTVKTVDIDYLGFTIDDEFVVGYGLDHAQRFRNLPDVRVIEDVE